MDNVESYRGDIEAVVVYQASMLCGGKSTTLTCGWQRGWDGDVIETSREGNILGPEMLSWKVLVIVQPVNRAKATWRKRKADSHTLMGT